MSVNVKTIPTILNSNGSSGAVVVTRIGANGVNADKAFFNHIDAESATINNLQSNNITTSVLNSEIVNGEIVNGTQGNFTELNAEKANIYKEDVNISNIGSLYADFAGIKDLNAKSATIDVAKITELFSGNITTDYLTVLKSAHFFELIIDQIKAVGGSVILSPADGFELYGWSDNINLPAQNASIRLWWIAEEGKNGKYNQWEVGDQALCQNFNNAQVGVSSNVSSKYCWAKVTSTHDNAAKYVVKLNPNAEWTTSSDPAPKDEVTVITNAIYLATHPTLKQGDFVPVMTQEEKRYDENNNPLNGLWKLNNGTTILTPEEYYALTPSEQENYSLYQDAYIAYVNANPIYITLEQYNGDDPYDGYTIRTYSKLEVKRCFSITISKSIADYTYYQESGVTKGSTFNFEEGDNFVQLGCQDTSLNRGNAIYLSAYNSIDQDLKAPLIAQYRNISTFDLSSCKWSWFDANGAKFRGQFILEDGTPDGTPIDESVYDYFKIVPDYNILTKNANDEVDQQTIKVSILSNINNVTSYDTTVPQGYTFRAESYKADGTIISAATTTKTSGESTASIPVPYLNSNFHHMILKLIKNSTGVQGSEKIVDEYILNIQLVSEGAQGSVGPQGSQGTAGDDGTNVTLLVAQELCGVRIDNVSTDEEFETMTTSLYTQLEYKLVQIVGDTATELDWGAANGYRLTLSCWDGTIQYTSNSHEGSNYQLNQTDGWKYGGVNEDNTKILIFTQSNILTDSKLNGNQGQNFTNYQWLMTNYNSNQTAHDRTPLKFKLELKDHSWDVVESRMIYVSYEPQSLFVNNKDILYSAKLGAQGYTDGWASQFSTELYQTNQEIGAQATRLNAGIQGTQASIAQVSLTANGAQSSVSQLTTDLNTNYYTKSEVNQTAEQISLTVLGQQGVTQEELNRTGINIEDGSITLNAKKTIITGELSLTNSNSGFVLYDEYGNPVIKIGNDSIGSFDDFNSSVLVYQWLNYVASSSSSWNITSNTKNIGTRVSGSSISLSGLILQLFAYQPDYSMSYPSSSTINATIQLLIGNTVKNQSQPITMTFNSTYGYYTYSGTVTINIPEDGNYTLRVVTSGISGTPVSNPYLNFGYQISYVSQKMIRLAKDGFASNPVANSFIWSNDEMQILKQGQNGLRLYNPNGETNSKGLQVFAGISRINNQDVERWYNYSNYTPTKTLLGTDFTTGTAYIGDGNYDENAKIYTVEQGYGCILIPSRNALFGSGQYSGNIYIKLPAFSDVVLGYSVKIINYGQDAKVRVIDGNNVSGHCYYIMDANMNMNTYIVCKSATGSGGEFIYVGQVTSHDEELNFHWRATCDV